MSHGLMNQLITDKNFSKKCPIGPFRLEKIFLGILSVIGGPKGTVSKKLKKKFFEPEGHFRTFFRKIFLSTITSGKFYVDPENLNAWVKWGQNVISSENNSSHDVNF